MQVGHVLFTRLSLSRSLALIFLFRKKQEQVISALTRSTDPIWYTTREAARQLILVVLAALMVSIMLTHTRLKREQTGYTVQEYDG